MWPILVLTQKKYMKIFVVNGYPTVHQGNFFSTLHFVMCLNVSCTQCVIQNLGIWGYVLC